MLFCPANWNQRFPSGPATIFSGATPAGRLGIGKS